MRRADQYMLWRDAGLLLDELSRLVAYDSVKPQQVAHDQGECGLAIVEHEAACVQFIVDILRGSRDEAADNRKADRRRDVAGRGPRTQFTGLGIRDTETPTKSDTRELDMDSH